MPNEATLPKPSIPSISERSSFPRVTNFSRTQSLNLNLSYNRLTNERNLMRQTRSGPFSGQKDLPPEAIERSLIGGARVRHDINDPSFVSQYRGTANTREDKARNWNCGPAALLNVLRGSGKVKGGPNEANDQIEDIRRKIGRTSEYTGVRPIELARAATKYGLNAEVSSGGIGDVKRKLAQGKQVIVALNMRGSYANFDKLGLKPNNKVYHFVQVKKIEGDRVLLHDPAFQKPIEISTSQLEKAMKGYPFKQNIISFDNSQNSQGKLTISDPGQGFRNDKMLRSTPSKPGKNTIEMFKINIKWKKGIELRDNKLKKQNKLEKQKQLEKSQKKDKSKGINVDDLIKEGEAALKSNDLKIMISVHDLIKEGIDKIPDEECCKKTKLEEILKKLEEKIRLLREGKISNDNPSKGSQRMEFLQLNIGLMSSTQSSN